MPTTLITRPGQAATSVSVTPYNLTGWALTAEFSSLPTFASVTTSGDVSYDLAKGYITLTLTGAQVDSLGTCYYRVRAIKSGSPTHFAAAGRIEYQNSIRTAVTADILVNGYLPEAYVGLISTIDYPVATNLVAGGIRLGGDLGGTSATPTVPGLAAKAPLNNPVFTGTIQGITKGMVGLANIDNTADVDKPVSTAQATAINAKYTKPGSGIPESDLASGVTAKLNAGAPGDASSSAKGLIQLAGDLGGTAAAPTVPGLSSKAPLASPTFSGTVSGISKAMVGLGNVDNTADSSKSFTASQLSNSTATGRSLIVATDAAAARSAISAVTLAGDLTGTAALPRVSTAAGFTFQNTDNNGQPEPTLYNADASGASTDGGPIRIGNVRGALRILPYSDGNVYIQSTLSNLQFSSLNGAQGNNLTFNYANSYLQGNVIVSGLVSSAVAAPTAAAHLTRKDYVDAIGATAATASTVVRRDAAGDIYVVDAYGSAAPTAANQLTRKDYVDVTAKAVTTSRTITASATQLAATDAQKLVIMNLSAAGTVVLPNDSAVSLPVGTWFEIMNLNVAAVTIQVGSGASIVWNGPYTTYNPQLVEQPYAYVRVQKTAANIWTIVDGVHDSGWLVTAAVAPWQGNVVWRVKNGLCYFNYVNISTGSITASQAIMTFPVGARPLYGPCFTSIYGDAALEVNIGARDAGSTAGVLSPNKARSGQVGVAVSAAFPVSW